ncbi:MAG: alpha/beta hydrolase [Fimbriimonadaceae bacterium]|nr:alpha/beta hydrolase [Alphaproteobacteria bacterium]
MAIEEPTLVFIPGLLSDDVVWQSVADAFAGQMPVFIADVTSGSSITGMAQNILTQLEGPLIVAGHSMGGRVALEMVRLSPKRIVRLILADTGVHPRSEGETPKREAVIRLAHEEGMQALADQWLPPMVDKDRIGDLELMGALNQMVLRADSAQHERQIRALMGRPDASGLLSKIACPVLFLVGRGDAWSPPEQHEDMAARTADAKLVIVEEAGHFLPIERPDAVITAMRDWMSVLPDLSCL